MPQRRHGDHQKLNRAGSRRAGVALAPPALAAATPVHSPARDPARAACSGPYTSIPTSPLSPFRRRVPKSHVRLPKRRGRESRAAGPACQTPTHMRLERPEYCRFEGIPLLHDRAAVVEALVAAWQLAVVGDDDVIKRHGSFFVRRTRSSDHRHTAGIGQRRGKTTMSTVVHTGANDRLVVDIIKRYHWS